RKRWRMGGFPIGVIGENADLRYDAVYLGAGPDTLSDIDGASHEFYEALRAAKKPMIVVGQGAISGPNGASVLASVAALAREIGAVTDGWNGFNVLHNAASRVGGLDIGFVPGEGASNAAEMAGGSVDLLFNLGADEIEIAAGPFVVYVGTHGDKGAHRADVILPGAAYTEKSGTWVNTEGRAQTGSRAAFPPGDAREEWAIFRALSAVLGKPLPFDSLSALRAELYAAHPHMRSDAVTAADPSAVTALADRAGTVTGAGFRAGITDFYLSNPIARASKVMAECSRLAQAEHLEAAE
ncbi:molybdopterin-dependent oxidoreductase, partial [Aureimonas sp. Leaf460]|uniref:molybdopterin-dependent oxidoreductase n=2 Tax=unclassified Aureimonas TaxID=2615206 RepID=UPI001FCDAA73